MLTLSLAMASVSSDWRREVDLTVNVEPAHEALDGVGAITTREVIGVDGIGGRQYRGPSRRPGMS